MNGFRAASIEEMDQVEGGFMGSLVDAVSRISTSIGQLVGKGVDLLTAPTGFSHNTSGIGSPMPR